MVSISVIKLYCVVAIIVAVVGIYFVTAHIDGLARNKYLKVRSGSMSKFCFIFIFFPSHLILFFTFRQG